MSWPCSRCGFYVCRCTSGAVWWKALDPRYCGAVTTYAGRTVACWRPADHDGDHQGEVVEDEETYSWVA